MSDSQFDRIVARLRDQFPGAALLALGQTAYWDEPMKAVLRRRLDQSMPEARMVVGIHDLDYFSKLPGDLNLPDEWAILPHNDGTTKDLWVATGEVSRLFGSETIPTRDDLTRHGVQLDKIAREFPSGRDALINMTTEAWGWRGLAHAASENEIACSIGLSESLPHLLKLLEWGFSHSLESVTGGGERGRAVADELLAEVTTYAEAHPDASITDLFRNALQMFYTRLLGSWPRNLEITAASELFRFNTSTASLPRFRLLEAFLDPSTRPACQESYDLAVEGSDTYTLDRFCPGAIPFDLVIPGRGRGTVCIRDGEIVLDMDEPISLPADALPETAGELAELIERHLGADTMLIGKALTLVLMMASEFVFVLHEQASAYVPRCEKMARLMKEREISLSFYPILRVGYRTWDCISACDATFVLPGHLAAAFRQGEITATEFADSWRRIVEGQEQLLDRMSRMSGYQELLTFFTEAQGEPWPGRMAEYLSALDTVRDITSRTEPLKAESIRLRDLSHQMKQQIQEMEVRKGEHFRESIKPIRDLLWQLESEGRAEEPQADEARRTLAEHEGKRAEITQEIDSTREEARRAHERSTELKRVVQETERGAKMQEARETLKRIEYEVELARLWIVRDAILASNGLRYTNHRPSAWWFLLADHDLHWFNRVAETAEFRFEEIDAENGQSAGMSDE